MSDSLNYNRIESFLQTKRMGRKIIYFDSLDSTNTAAKKIAEKEPEGTVVISEEQKSGRGRMGRSWVSPRNKGIWMSIILKPQIPPAEVPRLTQVAAAAVSLALASLEINSSIKWPNDILVNNKKVCGILTEMKAGSNKTEYAVTGIGLNVSLTQADLPPNLRHKATSLYLETKRMFDRDFLTAEILNNFEHLYYRYTMENDLTASLDICRQKSVVLGKKVRLVGQDAVKEVEVLDIDDEGRLVVKTNDSRIARIASGEISVYKN